MAVVATAQLEPVAQIKARLQVLLESAKHVKIETTIEPPLPTTELALQVDALYDGIGERYDQAYRNSALETAAREILYSLTYSLNIEDPTFVEVWNFLDILILIEDRGKSAPELACWLIEELLDSQTTAGCRIVFDFLESRRERLAARDFHKKNLVFLRTCNELLRRLSRAEDAIFCGRVFFFLFQTVPLGDRSAINLRGYYHVENVTAFEAIDTSLDSSGVQMNVDSTAAKVDPVRIEAQQPPTRPGGKTVAPKGANKAVEEELLSTSDLYPVFWRLQQDFTEPTRLFVKGNFDAFKRGLAHTMTKFKKTPTVAQSKSTEDTKRDLKRKYGEESTSGQIADHFVDTYNPKYLTSRDLFDLELSDLAFQRHILVQVLILLDFLLSLTEQAKQRLKESDANTNKSVLYAHTLSEDDSKWATVTRSSINTYLSTSVPDGKFYWRMVETVLARDKNWVRWKIEHCPPIVRDQVSTEQELEARKGARDATKPRRIPERPAGAMDLSFLEEGSGGGLEALKQPARFVGPSVSQLIDGIATDRLDLEMAMMDEEQASLENSMSNKTWRALRQTRATNLIDLDKLEPGSDLGAAFRPAERGGMPLSGTAEDNGISNEIEGGDDGTLTTKSKP